MANRIDPSTPLDNEQSPFYDLPEDAILLIFRRILGDTKTKMRLELVCRKFQDLIHQKTAWNHDNELIVREENDDNYGCTINGMQFDELKVSDALTILLPQITVTKLTLGDIFYTQNVMVVCNAMIEHRGSFNIDHIRLESDSDPAILCLNDIVKTISRIATGGIHNIHITIKTNSWATCSTRVSRFWNTTLTLDNVEDEEVSTWKCKEGDLNVIIKFVN